MNCPKCGTWNPEDKQVCWRCQTEMPKPVTKKEKKNFMFMGLPAWSWAIIVLMFIAMFVVQCLGRNMLGGQ